MKMRKQVATVAGLSLLTAGTVWLAGSHPVLADTLNQSPKVTQSSQLNGPTSAVQVPTSAATALETPTPSVASSGTGQAASAAVAAPKSAAVTAAQLSAMARGSVGSAASSATLVVRPTSLAVSAAVVSSAAPRVTSASAARPVTPSPVTAPPVVASQQALASRNVAVTARNLGVDVASYQPAGSQPYVQAGAKFVIAKVSQGTDYRNPAAQQQLASAKAAGALPMAYHYATFGANQQQAVAEANYALQAATAAGLVPGSYLACDYEVDASGNQAANTNAVIAFMNTVKAGHYLPLLYSGANYLQTHLNVAQIIQDFGSCLWVAAYPTTSPVNQPNFYYFPSMDGVIIWQYSDNWEGRSVDGDVNVLPLVNPVPVSTPSSAAPTVSAAPVQSATSSAAPAASTAPQTSVATSSASTPVRTNISASPQSSSVASAASQGTAAPTSTAPVKSAGTSMAAPSSASTQVTTSVTKAPASARGAELQSSATPNSAVGTASTAAVPTSTTSLTPAASSVAGTIMGSPNMFNNPANSSASAANPAAYAKYWQTNNPTDQSAIKPAKVTSSQPAAMGSVATSSSSTRAAIAQSTQPRYQAQRPWQSQWRVTPNQTLVRDANHPAPAAQSGQLPRTGNANAWYLSLLGLFGLTALASRWTSKQRG